MEKHPKTQRTLLVGASGQVGTKLREALAGTEVLCTGRNARPGWQLFDLATLDSVAQAAEAFDGFQPQRIICVGGMTAVDACESQPELAHRTNSVGPGLLAQYAYDRDLPYAYFSTEYIFDGSPANTESYAEDATPNPLSVYGKSKLEGERLVLAAHPQALILRTTVVYGADSREMNYIYSLMRNLAAGRQMTVPQDQVSTPTYNRDLAAATIALLDAHASGIFHVCGPERMGRLEFAERVATFLGLDRSLLLGVDTANLNQPAPRPLSAGLSIAKLRSTHPAITMRPLSEALLDCGGPLRAFLSSLPSS